MKSKKDPKTKLLLTIPEACSLMGWSRRKLNQAIEAGDIVAIADGARYKIPTASLNDYIARKTAAEAQAVPA